MNLNFIFINTYLAPKRFYLSLIFWLLKQHQKVGGQTLHEALSIFFHFIQNLLMIPESYRFCLGCRYFIPFGHTIVGNLLRKSPGLSHPARIVAKATSLNRGQTFHCPRYASLLKQHRLTADTSRTCRRAGAKKRRAMLTHCPSFLARVRPPGLEPGTHGLKVHCSTS